MLDAVGACSRGIIRRKGMNTTSSSHTRKRVTDAGCSDPLVLYAAGRGYTFFNRKYEDTVPLYMEAARRMSEAAYHPLLRCEANLRRRDPAAAETRPTPEPPGARDAA